MRWILRAALLLALGLSPSHPAHGQVNARAIVARSVQALGGEARLSKARGVWSQIKGNYYLVPSQQIPITAEVCSQLPDQVKVIYHLRGGDRSVIVVDVITKEKSWHQEDGVTRESDKAAFEDDRESNYVNYVSSLLPLLQDKRFQLKALPDTQVNGTAADGVAVNSEGHPEIRLYFDKQSGFLIKIEHQRPKAGTRDPGLREEYLSDYQDVFSTASEEQLLKAAKIATDDAALLAFVRKRTLNAAQRTEIAALIRKLGDASFEVREKAKEDLIKVGEPARSLLTPAVKDSDPEIASKARECLKAIGDPVPPPAARAVVRLLALRRPAGATEALLDYLPCAGEEMAMMEAKSALAAVAVHDGKPDAALVAALQDKDPDRRAAAAAALGRGPEKGQDRLGQQLFLPGIKRPRKGIQYRDGKKEIEYEEVDVRFYSKFKNDVFAKP
jgi:hypothetical protein